MFAVLQFIFIFLNLVLSNQTCCAIMLYAFGGLAQLVRAPAPHAGGHWFESSNLHQERTPVLIQFKTGVLSMK